MMKSPVAAAVSAVLAQAALLHSQAAFAADAADELEVIVTATRRAEDIHDVPLNIAALGGGQLEAQGAFDLAEMGRLVPGLFVVDQGPRASNRIVVRGLNATSLGGTEALGNSGGDTVATYVGEIPLFVDLKPVDMERVEVLLGPQGTLYGAGTLAGAIRYIPNRPQFDETTLGLRGDAYGLSESDGIGGKGGFTVNVPFSDTLAFRASVEYLDDPGFIDYGYVVREGGVSDAEPDFSDPAAVAANLRREEDADYEQTLYARAALRWRPSDIIDATLTYYYQDQEVGGRSLNNVESFGTGRYESGARYLEPNDRTNQLGSLEVTADLGFAELTSATGVSKFEDDGQRDQTDLLITLEYGYEAFPQFSAFTHEEGEEKTYTQEFRLVSKNEGPLGWIAGAFYNKFESDDRSSEFTPNFSEWVVAGAGGQVRPDALEYYSVDTTDRTEKALYGELSYDLTAKWQVVVGGRYYKYDLDTKSAVDFPLLYTTIVGDRGPDDIVLNFENGGQEDSGSLFKFNTSYDFNDDVMGYLTVSEGYRIGNSNGLPECPEDINDAQNACATPDELEFSPDQTTNYEVGFHTRWFDQRLTLNAALYYIDWKDPQVSSSSLVGAIPITKNGKGAESKGFELSFAAEITERFSVNGSYAYTRARLTELAPSLLTTIVDPPDPAEGNFITQYVDGQDGDRLPGSPEQQGTLYFKYDLPLANGWAVDLNYGLAAIGDVLTRTGGRASGETLPGFAISQAWATLKATDQWSLSLYADNLFDKYAVTGARSTPLYNKTVSDENGDPVRVRSYSHDVLRPREIGLRFTYNFAL